MDKGEEEKQGDEKENEMTIKVQRVNENGVAVQRGGRMLVYLDNVPAFVMNGEDKEPITPNGWSMYRNNARDVDYWLERQKHPNTSPSGQLG